MTSSSRNCVSVQSVGLYRFVQFNATQIKIQATIQTQNSLYYIFYGRYIDYTLLVDVITYVSGLIYGLIAQR